MKSSWVITFSLSLWFFLPHTCFSVTDCCKKMGGLEHNCVQCFSLSFFCFCLKPDFLSLLWKVCELHATDPLYRCLLFEMVFQKKNKKRKLGNISPAGFFLMPQCAYNILHFQVFYFYFSTCLSYVCIALFFKLQSALRLFLKMFL